MKLNKLFVSFAISFTAGVSVNATTSSTFVPLQLPGVCNSAFTSDPSWENVTALFSNVFNISGSLSGFPEVALIGSAFGDADTIHSIYTPGVESNDSQLLCIQGMLSEINTEFQYVLAQIQQIETIMNLNDTFILEEINENSNTDLSLAYQNYIEQVANVIGEENYQTMGAYQNLINIVGFEQTGDNHGSIPDLLTDLAKSQLLAAAYEDNSDALQQAFFNISGVEFNRDDCDDEPQNCVSFLKPAALQSGASSLSASPLINVLNAARAELYTKISSTLSANVSLLSQNNPDIASQLNIVELYPPYNQFITSLYHRSLSAITASYYILRAANTINALKAANAGFVISDDDYYMPEVVYIPGAYYKPIPIGSNTLTETQAQNKQALEQALLYLDTFYAGLVNQLYENILSYIVTDDPIKGQLSGSEAEKWPRASNNIIYNSTVNGQTEYWTIPDSEVVDGYSCLYASGSGTYGGAAPTYTSAWSSAADAENISSYKQCKNTYSSSDLVLSEVTLTQDVKNIDCRNSSGSIDTNCYIWGKINGGSYGISTATMSKWGEIPPGATIVDQKLVTASDVARTEMPDATEVQGYACLKAISTYNATSNGVEFTNWENQDLTYGKCFEQSTKQNPDLAISLKAESSGSTTKMVDCLNGSNYATGCYIWGELTTESPDDTYAITTYTPWGQTPPGGTQVGSSGLSSVIIKNTIDYDSIVASNVFKPSKNPPPTASTASSADAPGNPYFQLNDTLSENTYIYQAHQIREVNNCISAYIAAAESSMTVSDYFSSSNFEASCPSFFPAQYLLNSGSLTTTPPSSSTASTYASTSPIISTMTGGPNLGNDDDSTTSEILAPMYYDSSTGKVKQYGKMYGVLSGCQTSDALYTYIPESANTTAQKDVPYISCRLWQLNDVTQLNNSSVQFNNESAIFSGLGGETDTQSYIVQSVYNEPYNTNGSNGYKNTTTFTPAQSTDPSNIPAFTQWFITGTTYSPTTAGTANPYFNGSGANISIINPNNSCGADCTNLTYNISAGALTTGDSVVHGIALNYEIDNFIYPLTLFMYHRETLAGNGFFVVQNAVLNNVGFIGSDNKAIPITTSYEHSTITTNDDTGSADWQVPYIAQGYPNSGDQNLASVANTTIQYNDLQADSYTGVFTIINGVAFYINSSQPIHPWTSRTNEFDQLQYYFAWPGSNIFIEYGLLSSETQLASEVQAEEQASGETVTIGQQTEP